MALVFGLAVIALSVQIFVYVVGNEPRGKGTVNVVCHTVRTGFVLPICLIYPEIKPQ